MEAQSVKSLQSDYLKADITDKYIDLNKKAMFYNERIPTKGVKHADVINFNILLSEIVQLACFSQEFSIDIKKVQLNYRRALKNCGPHDPKGCMRHALRYWDIISGLLREKKIILIKKE